MSLELNGVVSFRSSVNRVGPPGEREIIKLNPQRRESILRITGWPDLEPGTLNIDTDRAQLDKLTPATAVWIEDGASVVYPAPYQHIPRKREAYLYYLATLLVGLESRPVIVRRAKTPGPIRLEVFATENLVSSLKLKSGQVVTLTVG